MRARRLLTVLRAALVLLIALGAALLVGCGGDDTAAGDGGQAGGRPAGLPSVPVVDLRTGEELALVDAPRGGKALLVWFWAPSCVICRGEAPGIERFARRNAPDIEVIGLGAKDSRDDARAFVRRHGLRSPRMVYDDSRDSWEQLGIPAQPAAILYDAGGKELRRWFGPLDDAQVLEAARS